MQKCRKHSPPGTGGEAAPSAQTGWSVRRLLASTLMRKRGIYKIASRMYLEERGIARDLERVLDTIRQNLTTPSAPDSGKA